MNIHFQKRLLLNMCFSKPTNIQFNEKEKLWSQPESKELKTSFGKLLLSTLSNHGSKVAQVFIFGNILLQMIKLTMFYFENLDQSR